MAGNDQYFCAKMQRLWSVIVHIYSGNVFQAIFILQNMQKSFYCPLKNIFINVQKFQQFLIDFLIMAWYTSLTVNKGSFMTIALAGLVLNAQFPSQLSNGRNQTNCPKLYNISNKIGSLFLTCITNRTCNSLTPVKVTSRRKTMYQFHCT